MYSKAWIYDYYVCHGAEQNHGIARSILLYQDLHCSLKLCDLILPSSTLQNEVETLILQCCRSTPCKWSLKLWYFNAAFQHPANWIWNFDSSMLPSSTLETEFETLITAMIPSNTQHFVSRSSVRRASKIYYHLPAPSKLNLKHWFFNTVSQQPPNRTWTFNT